MDDILTWEKEVAHILVTQHPLKPMNICPWNQFTMIEIVGDVFFGKMTCAGIEIFVTIEGHFSSNHTDVKIVHLLYLFLSKLAVMLQVFKVFGNAHLPFFHLSLFGESFH